MAFQFFLYKILSDLNYNETLEHKNHTNKSECSVIMFVFNVSG